MRYIKRMLVIAIVLIILLMIILLILLNNREAEYKENYANEGGNEQKIDTNLKEVENATYFYTISDCVQKYLDSITTARYEDTTAYGRKQNEMTESDKNKRIYNELSASYIRENSITEQNIRSFVHKTNEQLTFYPLKMNVMERSARIKNYAVYGMLRSITDSNANSYIYIVVTIDDYNMTFAITPIIDKQITELNQIDLEINIEEIARNDNNVFSYQRVKEDGLIDKYISAFKMYALNYPEIAYEYLDEEYRNAKFGSIEAFKQYVNENREKIISITLDKYQKTIKDNYTQYVCIDTNGNYFIFRETAVMQFTLLPDTYTIDIPEFTQKYNKADNETKMGMNIEKINSALNNKDYKYIYSKLADSFKSKYFPTEESLKQYLQTNLYEKNTIEYESVDNEGSNYMFDIQFKDAQNSSAEGVSKRIIMQLKQGTDFVISFNVN